MPAFHAFLDQPVPEAGHYLFPAAPDTNEQRVIETRFSGTEPVGALLDVQGRTRTWLLDLRVGDTPEVSLIFEESGPGLPDAAFVPLDTAYERASPELVAQVHNGLGDQPLDKAIPALMQFVGDHFTYGQRERHLGDGDDAMPPLECGLTLGTCVDIHTVAVAALRGIGAQAVYIMGVQIADGKETGPTGHCWVNVRHPGVPHHWDISHHIQYGVREITPALNPKPGRRFALSSGRGPQFEGADGLVQFPSLSGFQALSGPLRGQKLRTIGHFD